MENNRAYVLPRVLIQGMTILKELPSGPGSVETGFGYLYLKEDGNLYFVNDSDETINLSVGGYSESFDSTSETTWTVLHNLNSFDINIQCFDDDGAGAQQIIPNSITLTDLNTVTIDWGTVVQGKCIIIRI